eukprot:1143459-Pelagomonas_calceolata.AAC.4
MRRATGRKYEVPEFANVLNHGCRERREHTFARQGPPHVMATKVCRCVNATFLTRLMMQPE